MGTRLLARGLDLRQSDTSHWNLAFPEIVRSIHEADLAAGAGWITCNTFGANRFWLDRYQSKTQVRLINQKAVEIAREAIGNSGKKAIIAGSIGPTAFADELTLREQAEALVAAGADCLLFETLSQAEAEKLVEWKLADEFSQSWVSLYDWGKDPAETAQRLLASGFRQFGMNCLADKKQIELTLDKLIKIEGIEILVKPSAMPAHKLLEIARKYAGMGLVAIGGCCGTDERFIRELAEY
jgi:methionine synthase I (cobalamin-dependent)